MKWKNYETDIVQQYGVYITGWPKKIPFANLSIASSGKPELNRLLKAWQDRTTMWCAITESERCERKRALDAKYVSGEIPVPIPRKERSDQGKKCACNDDSDDGGEAGPLKRSATDQYQE
jgi:hypothetical protein